MPGLPRGQKHPIELRERAVRMVFEHQYEYSSQWQAISSVAEKLNLNRETLRNWIRKAEVDDGRRPGLSSDDREPEQSRNRGASLPLDARSRWV